MMNSVISKKIEQSGSILRHSIFCGSAVRFLTLNAERGTFEPFNAQLPTSDCLAPAQALPSCQQ
jgi:hypothetical protein